jgi:1-acyl-sn-glycerol-3-phosphate acyltransferase
VRRLPALPVPEARCAEQLQVLVQETTAEFLDILGLAHARRSRALWSWLLGFAAARFAREIATFDQIVGAQGLQQAAGWLLERHTIGLDIAGRAGVPASGPLLVVANHPGLTDTAALLAALARPDLHVVAIDRLFLRALPHTSERLISVSPERAGRRHVLHAIDACLDRGQAVLVFPAGRLEPDPLVQTGSAESAEGWSRSIGLLLKPAPEVWVLPALVGSVRSKDALAHPLTRLRRLPHDQHRVAALLQTLLPLYHRVRVRVAFGAPVLARSLRASNESPSGITRAIAAQVHQLLPDVPSAGLPGVAEGPPARRMTLLQQL